MVFDWGFMIESGLRLLLAIALGGAIGLQREMHDKPAGFRTHMLVCLGSALVMIISTSFFDRGDPGRIAAQVVSGVGFLGAGTIIRRGNITVGLTTAASLWAVAGVGLAVGHPDYRFGILATMAAVLVLATLTIFSRFEWRFVRRPRLQVLRIAAAETPELVTLVTRAAEAAGAHVSRMRIERGAGAEAISLEIEVDRLVKGQIPPLVQRVSEVPGVLSVRFEGAAGRQPVSQLD